MQDLLTSLLATLQSLMLLLAAQGMQMPEATQLLAQADNATRSPTPTQMVEEPPRTHSFTSINKAKAGAVVNILCRASGKLKSGTASGVIISPTGLMLANAHIAQYMLLEQATDAPISCTVRTGSPARDTYKAEVLYIPPAWVAKHGSQITQTEQYGTGEDDYALLQITEMVNHNPLSPPPPLPSTFTYISPDTNGLATRDGQSILIRAYPAELLGSQITLHSLHPTATVAQITETATFTDPSTGEPTTRDLISLGGSIVAQGGSSGGAVVGASGNLIGIIVTSTHAKQTSERTLRAITTAHINSSLKLHTGKSLAELINTKPDVIAQKFKYTNARSAGVLANFLNN